MATKKRIDYRAKRKIIKMIKAKIYVTLTMPRAALYAFTYIKLI